MPAGLPPLPGAPGGGGWGWGSAPLRQLDFDEAARHLHAGLRRHLDADGDAALVALSVGVDAVDHAIEVRHVADERRVAVLDVAVGNETELARPVGNVVEHP